MLEKEERDQGFCYRKVTFAQLYPGPEICTFYDSLNLRLSSSLLGVSHCQLHSTLTREGAGGQWKQRDEAAPSRVLAGGYTEATSALALQRFLPPTAGIPAKLSDTCQVR